MNKIPMSEMARGASSYIAAIEQATPSDPVPLELLTQGEPVPDLLEENLKAADELWDRHEEVFFPEELPIDNLESLDFDAALRLSRDVIQESRAQRQLFQAAHLGVIAMQLATMAAEMVRDPSLVVVDDRPSDHIAMAQTIAEKSGELSKDVFAATLASRLRGNYSKLPAVFRAYLGDLRNTQAAFWRENRFAPASDYYGVISLFPPEVNTGVEELLMQYPAKALIYDGHSLQARPERRHLRAAQVKAIDAFNSHWEDGGPVVAAGLQGNLNPAMAQVGKALKSAHEKDIPPSQRLPLIARDAAAIVGATRRNSFGDLLHEKGLVHFDGPPEDPRLTVNFPELPKNVTSRAIEKFIRKAALAGVCTARNFVALPSGGETQANAQEFYAGFRECFGLARSALQEHNGTVYLHVGSLSVDYALLASAHNDFS